MVSFQLDCMPNWFGIEPVNELEYKFNDWRLLIRTIALGTVPDKEFNDKSSVANFTRFAISVGIEPWSFRDASVIAVMSPFVQVTPYQALQILVFGIPLLQTQPGRPAEETVIEAASLHIEIFCIINKQNLRARLIISNFYEGRLLQAFQK